MKNTDDEPVEYRHFDIVGLKQAPVVAALVHKLAHVAGLSLPVGLPTLPAGHAELTEWVKSLPRKKRGHNGFIWEVNHGRISYVMALVDPVTKQDLCVLTYLIMTRYDHEWHFKVSGRLAGMGLDGYDAWLAELAKAANADVIGDMAADYALLGY